MPIALITGPANSGKARVVLDRLRRHVTAGETAGSGGPLLVVPTGADVDRYRRELAEEGPISGAAVSLFSVLLERIARCAAAEQPALGDPPLGAVARERLLRTLAAEVWPETAGAGTGFARALAAAVADLQVASVSPKRLKGALGEGSGSAGIGEIHERYLAALRRIGRLDVEMRSRLALDVLRRSPALWRGAPVLFYGFDDLTPLQLDAIETLGAVVDAPVAVSLAYEPGRAAFSGRAWAFHELEPIAAEHVQMPPRAEHYAPQARATLHHIERYIFEPDAPAIEPGGCLRLLEGGSQRAELELVAAEARRLIDDGVPPHEIAIVHRSPTAIADLLGEVLASFGVPHAIAARIPLSHTALGNALLGLLRCGASPEEATLGDVLAWLRFPGVLERVELADRLEQRALRSGATDATSARQMWERDRWPLDRLDRIAEAAADGPLRLLERVERDLLWLFRAPRQGAAQVLARSEAEEGLALQAALGALAQLRELAAGEKRLLGGAQGMIEALADVELPRSQVHVPEAVAVLDPLSLRARRVKALLLCGLQEGVFPLQAVTEPILTERVRRSAGDLLGGRLARREEVLDAERYLLYATISRPEQLLCLSWHAASDEGSATPPSLFVDDVCDLFSPSLMQRRRRRALGAVDAVDLEAASADLEVAAADLAAATGTQAHTEPQAPTDAPSQAAPGAQGASKPPGGIEALRDERLLAELAQRSMWSASSLELWAACPVKWFVEKMLRAEDLDPDSEALAKGGLAHAVLNDVLAGLREQTGSARLTPARLAAAQRLMEQALARHAGQRPLSVLPEREAAAMRRLQADLQRYLRHAAEEESPLEPAHLELPFGFPEEQEALPPFDLGDGVLLRGRIDRVDVGEGGEAVVYDYKSGRGGADYSASKWLAKGRFQMALYMRAAEQALGVEAVGGLYQPLSGGDLRARGALASDGGVQLPCVRTDSCEMEQLAELIDAVSEAALMAAREAREGRIEPRPRTCSPRGGCSYPTICRCRQ